MENFGRGTALDVPLGLAEQVMPGFREDFGRGLVEDSAVGIWELGVTGVQLSPSYRLFDPAGQDRRAAQLRDTAKFAYQEPGEFLKQAAGVDHIEDGHPGRFTGGWAAILATGGTGAAVKAPAAVTRAMPDLKTRDGARTTMQDLTDRANRELGEDINRAQEHLSPREFLAAQEHARIAPLSYGKAVERRVADLIQNAPSLQQNLRHLGGPNQPDFELELPDGSTMRFDVTTDSPREGPRHLDRSYGEDLELLRYRRPDGLAPFPRLSPGG
jgi:hypothetical protein